MRPSLDVHIEELVLHGLGPADGPRIAAALQAELARLCAEQGVPPSFTAAQQQTTLDGGSFEMEPGLHPEPVGGQIARALYGALVR